MEDFKENIKKWIILEKKITEMKEEHNIKIKEYKNIKGELEKNLTEYMENNNLKDSIIKVSDSKIKYTETNIPQPITYKFLLEIFSNLFNSSEKAEEIINYIKQKREIKKNINLKIS